MRSILVGTDLSPRSERAVRRANLLARRISCPLTVIHVVDDDLPTSMAEQMISGAKETIAASLRRIPDAEASIADVVVARGEDWRTIVNEAYARNSDLIVLGSHRMTAVGFLHGSTMERVIRATHRTVLVVRDEPRGSYQNVLAAVDFSVASRYAVQAALAVAPDADFHLVHAYQVSLPAFLSRNSARDEAPSAARCSPGWSRTRWRHSLQRSAVSPGRSAES